MMSLIASIWRTASPCPWGSSLNSAVAPMAARSWNGSLRRPEVREANWRRKPEEALRNQIGLTYKQLPANPPDAPVCNVLQVRESGSFGSLTSRGAGDDVCSGSYSTL